MLASSSKGKMPKSKDDHPEDVMSAVGAAAKVLKAQVSGSRQVYNVGSNDEMITD
jgi:hypothetical protein